MAEIENRFEDNVPGAYYVDTECICCSICAGVAPDLFKASEEGGHLVVYRQPADEAERALAEEAVEACPAEAIGKDGRSAGSQS